MAILIVAEHDHASLSDQTAKALSAAKEIGGDMHILVAGKDAKPAAADAAAKLDGVAKVLARRRRRIRQPACRAAGRPHRLACRTAYDTLMAPATTSGKNVMPRVAALLDVMQISDIIEVKAPIRSSGRSMPAMRCRPCARPTPSASSPCARRRSPPLAKADRQASRRSPLPAIKGLSSFVKDAIAESDRPELTSAKIIISGGRALGSSEKFQEVILPVADKLGAAVGASRAAVDAGYAPNDWQVGQTGKVVAPDLYIACGISGAIQHLAGMKDSKVIVAINKDEEAPIFQVADYGLVADLFEALPELEKAL
jgi:electron transfer flavoprotein alpha subunit